MIVFLSAGAASAQLVSVGVKGGLPLTDNFHTGGTVGVGMFTVAYSTKTKRYTVGPAVTFRLPRRLAVEVDALYRHLDYGTVGSGKLIFGDVGVAYSWRTTSASRLDIPMLVRWPVPSRVYVVAGPALAVHYGFIAHYHNIVDALLGGHSDTSGTSTEEPGDLQRRVATGVVFGAGYDGRAGRLHIKPEFRYSRWITRAFGNGGPDFYSQPNELEFLLGFEFGAR